MDCKTPITSMKFDSKDSNSEIFSIFEIYKKRNLIVQIFFQRQNVIYEIEGFFFLKGKGTIVVKPK